MRIFCFLFSSDSRKYVPIPHNMICKDGIKMREYFSFCVELPTGNVVIVVSLLFQDEKTTRKSREKVLKNSFIVNNLIFSG